MVKLEGTLKTRVIHGRNGDFSVGSLLTNIGEFSVKDPMLEQYSEGEYQGEFLISKIFPSSYAWGGAVRVEIRAIIESVNIFDSQEKAMPVTPEPDPLVIDEAQQPQKTPNDKPVKSDKPETQQSGQSETKPQAVSAEMTVDQALFGSVQVKNCPGDEVKLDLTVDRQLVRQQRDKLRELGYAFDAKRQLWVK